MLTYVRNAVGTDSPRPSGSLTVRRADAGDRDRLLEWRNEPMTVANSETRDAVSGEAHDRWFGSYLAGTPPMRKLIFIGEKEGRPVGSIRFDCADDAPGAATISIVIDPLRRGEGIGALLLDEGMRAFEQSASARVVLWNGTYLARVREENAASRRIFERCGFQLQTEETT